METKINENYNHSCVVIDTGIYPHIDFVLGKNRIIKFVDIVNSTVLYSGKVNEPHFVVASTENFDSNLEYSISKLR